MRRARTRPRLTRAACASRSGAPSSIVVRRSRVAPRVAGSPAVGHPGWRAPRTAARMPRVVSRGSCASCAGCRTRRLAYDGQTAVDEWRRSPRASARRASRLRIEAIVLRAASAAVRPMMLVAAHGMPMRLRPLRARLRRGGGRLRRDARGGRAAFFEVVGLRLSMRGGQREADEGDARQEAFHGGSGKIDALRILQSRGVAPSSDRHRVAVRRRMNTAPQRRASALRRAARAARRLARACTVVILSTDSSGAARALHRRRPSATGSPTRASSYRAAARGRYDASGKRRAVRRAPCAERPARPHAPDRPAARRSRGRLPREDARAGRLGHARVQGPPALGTSPCVHHFAQYFAP
ncbi:hypothetical protein BMA1166 [Burkholderia mallei ATCC 23344]|uniref:Uncharacterized protein n=1 Tax=Burkholderia mallei (strain ATCC 23344) TaxID=243160 RepID=A0A0H2WEU0_BURMA|nr:hypothetical protein BMA1166 [Burkholderia mallei ATCC 23344]